jgi:uncharacterized membrane protein
VGDHVVEGTPLAWAWRRGPDQSPVEPQPLSPAINDPYTGIQAVHHLSVLLCMLAGRRLGDRLHRDAQGTLRVAVPLLQFADYLRLGTAQLRRSGAKEPAVTPA